MFSFEPLGIFTAELVAFVSSQHSAKFSALTSHEIQAPALRAIECSLKPTAPVVSYGDRAHPDAIPAEADYGFARDFAHAEHTTAVSTPRWPL